MPWQKAGIPIGIPRTNLVIPTPLITVYATSAGGVEVGYVSDLNYTTTRRAERVRHLNFTDAGRVIEQVPAPEDLTLNATGFALFKSTLLGRIIEGGTDAEGANKVFHSLNTQKYPFDIEVYAEHPATGDKVLVIFLGCWVTNFASPISIRNVFIAQTVTLQPSNIKTVEPEEEEQEAIAGLTSA